MRKIIIILAVLLGNMVNAQSVDTLANVEIDIINNKVSVYCLSEIIPNYKGENKYETVVLISDSLQNELSNFISIINTDYINIGDTAYWALFQSNNQSIPLGVERIVIQSKLSSYFPLMKELSQPMQYGLYFFGEKIKGNIKKGLIYEN